MTREFRELSDHRPGLPPPQFSLLSILMLTASAAGIIVLGVHAGPTAALAGIVVLLSVLAHMAGTAIGGRLRGERGKSSAVLTTDQGSGMRIRQPTTARPSDFAQTTQLSHKKALHRKSIVWSIGLGASFASILGATILCMVMWDDLSAANVLFGTGSSAVIGGMIGFWLGSLFQVARGALSEAQDET